VCYHRSRTLRGAGKDTPLEYKSRNRVPVDAYDIHHLTADIVGLVDTLGEKTAVVVGHDCG
jgi:pimeloyl-ACP methyl ester carboxylesterase